MTRKALPFAFALLLVALPVAAGNGPGSGTGSGPGPVIDPAAAFSVSGTVTSFTAAFGSGMPMLVVDDPSLGSVEIGLGPLWFIQEAGFTAAVGDEVEALVVTCDICSAETVALWVDNLTTGASIVLRGDDGVPLWIQRQGTGGGQGFCAAQADGVQSQFGEQRSGGNGGNGNGGSQGSGPNAGNGNGDGTGNGNGPEAGPNGNGPAAGTNGNQGGQCEWTGPDMTQVATVTGTVLNLEVGFHQSRPSVLLDVDGEEMQIVFAPYAPLAAAGFLIKTGDVLEITYAPWTIFGGEEVLVALAVTDPATGLTVQLRDPETGYPVTGGGGGFGPGFGYGPGPGDGN